MGSKGGRAPPPPDPFATASAQTQSNVGTAIANSYLIPFPYQSDLTIYGKDVMDFTVLGLRSM